MARTGIILPRLYEVPPLWDFSHSCEKRPGEPRFAPWNKICRTELFYSRGLNPPHLCNAAFSYKENETLENIQENNCKLCCMATQWPFGFFSEQHPTRLCTRSPESACRSTIATGQPITRLLTFQETDMQHDTRPDESTERLLGGLPTISRCPAGTETL